MAYQPSPVNAWLAYTATPLAANESWTTGWIDYNGYEGFTICRFADQNSAAGGDTIETSVNAGASPLPTTPGSYLATDMTKISAFSVTRGTHIRYTFTNGPVAQTVCFIGIRANSGATSPQVHTVFQNVVSAMTAALSKSMLVLPDSPVTGGVFALITRTLNSLNVNVTNLPATQPVSGSVSVSNLPATQPVSGTVNVGNFPATQPVSGAVSVSNFPATQPVSGTVAISGTPAVTATITGTPAVTISGTPSVNATVSNFPATQPVSGTVAISGTPSVNATIVGTPNVAVTSAPVTQVIPQPLVTANVWSGAQVFAANKHMLTLYNSGAGIIRIHRFTASNLQLTNVNGVAVQFNVTRFTGAPVGGVAAIVTANDTNDSIAGLSATSGATIAVLGAVQFAYATTNDEVGATTANAANAVQALATLTPDIWEAKPLTLRPGQGVTIQNVTATTLGSFGFSAVVTIE